jgi:NAD(P)-dependent dehydrogenase (short-subunit alcohol dehydrogenase family)
MVGRRVVVTGGAKGIGLAVLERFVADGDTVVALGRDETALASVADRAETAVCDVTDPDTVAAVFAGLGRIDVLVNNAGAASSAPVSRLTVEEMERLWRINTIGVMLCTQAALPAMREHGEGRVVTVASYAARVGAPYIAAYVSSKHAALGFMRSVAAELRGTGVTANTVCPAYVETEMAEQAITTIREKTGVDRAGAIDALVGFSGLGRLIRPEEVAEAVAYFAGERSGAVNGQSLVIDGGGLQF